MSFRVQLEDFAGFYTDTYLGAYRLALGIVRSPAAAEDVVQDAYAAAYRQRLRFRGDVPASAWLHRIVVNGALSALRRNPRTRVRELGAAEADTHAPDRDLGDALDALDGRSRAAIVLRYFYGYDYAAISAILGVSPGNVGMILTRALRRLRQDLIPDERWAEPR